VSAQDSAAAAAAAAKKGAKPKSSRLSGLIGQLRRKFGLASAKTA
jgi:hypothetical protein